MRRSFVIAVLASSSLALVAPAAEAAAKAAAPAAAPAAATAAASAKDGFQADLLENYKGVADHLLALADAMPAEKFGWRPGEGVRSFAEVLGHVSAANFEGSAALGVPMPKDIEPGKLEGIADKAKAIATVRASIEQFEKAAAGVPAGELDEQVELFGMTMSKRAVMLLLAGHGHEHTGQLIAYARMNGVVPPWSLPKKN